MYYHICRLLYLVSGRVRVVNLVARKKNHHPQWFASPSIFNEYLSHLLVNACRQASLVKTLEKECALTQAREWMANGAFWQRLYIFYYMWKWATMAMVTFNLFGNDAFGYGQSKNNSWSKLCYWDLDNLNRTFEWNFSKKYYVHINALNY